MIFTKSRYDRLTVIKRSQRVEKGVHLEKMQFYTLRRLRESEQDFAFCEGGRT